MGGGEVTEYRSRPACDESISGGIDRSPRGATREVGKRTRKRARSARAGRSWVGALSFGSHTAQQEFCSMALCTPVYIPLVHTWHLLQLLPDRNFRRAAIWGSADISCEAKPEVQIAELHPACRDQFNQLQLPAFPLTKLNLSAPSYQAHLYQSKAELDLSERRARHIHPMISAIVLRDLPSNFDEGKAIARPSFSRLCCE